MELPVVKNTNLEQLMDKAEVVQLTAAQIMKDFGMFGVEITFSGNISNAYQELHQQLVDQITSLVESNYDLLLSVLYQVDITNREIEQAEKEMPHYSNIEVIAHQVIARDLKKVLLRRYFKLKDKEDSGQQTGIDTK